MRRHYVVFLSPGVLVSESTRRPIAKWSTKEAVAMSQAIVERYGARPFGFYFLTQVERDPVPDGEGGMLDVLPRSVAESGVHYIHSRLLRFEDIADTPENHILRFNMRGSRCPLAVELNGYRSAHFFREGDVICGTDGAVTERGDDPKLVEYRQRVVAAWDQEDVELLAAVKERVREQS